MARIDDLIDAIGDSATRNDLRAEVAQLKSRLPFGLIFERHQPESVLLASSVGLRPGDHVVHRASDRTAQPLTVVSVHGDTAALQEADGTPAEPVTIDQLQVLNGFAQPIYPALDSLGRTVGSADRPFHSVINGENFHALKVLAHCHVGQVDCVYIDPPYNTGARDWKYNNDYVDDADKFRHSKWLSFMEKRLRSARELLKPNGVLIVTIDENEVHHLGVLLEQLFPTARRQMVTIRINPSGASGAAGLSRVDEYALFCFFGDAQPVDTDDDMLANLDSDGAETDQHGVRWERLMRGGNAWYRVRRQNLCYPVLLNDDKTVIQDVRPPYTGPEDQRPSTIDGHPVAWPVRKDGKLGIWRVEGAKLLALNAKGYAQVSSPPNKENPTLRYLLGGTVERIELGELKVTGRGERGQVEVEYDGETGKRRAKTMWIRARHVAGGSGGTHMLNALLGGSDVFPFPKSVYAVRDCLEVAVGNRPDALIVDFFAGSGTTLHATALLNAGDGGHRRSVLVTNNEVSEDTARQLHEKGLYIGDPDFEAHGIFEAATRPRIEAALSGTRSDGNAVDGEYIDGRPLSAGFEENCEFFRLDYLDPDNVELGRSFQAIHPLLWLIAGANGERNDTATPADGFAIAAASNYAILFDETQLPAFAAALAGEPVEHVFLVTDSEDAYSEMAGMLGAGRRPHMLYRDYLRSFRVTLADR